MNRSCGSEGGGGVEAQATTTAAHNLSEVFNDCTGGGCIDDGATLVMVTVVMAVTDVVMT